MSMYVAIMPIIAGICLGYVLFYLFVWLRRRQDKRPNLLFSIFALGYAGTLLMGFWYRSQTTVDGYLAISRWDGIFIWMAFLGLNWNVAEYTAVKSRWYLRGMTAVISQPQ